MPAITTKYLSPTNTRGARIKISADGNKAQIIPFSYDAPNYGGVHSADVLRYARDCWPHAAIESVSGPHRLTSEIDVWTF
jgi:hypothetical protein